MKATELRMGNLVNEYGIPINIMPNHIIGLHQIEIANKKCIDLLPIPLTVEWLLELGFVCDDDEGVDYIIKEEPLFILQNIDNELGHVWDQSFTNAPIKYVHQLQNLYFALTGKELVKK